MKRGTTDHPKLLELAAGLDIPRYAAVGLLESLWHWTSRYAIQGNPGKWSNKAIAIGLDWRGDADNLIEVLVNSRWLELAPEPHRLVVHDIADHADNTWRQNLSDAGLTWWNGDEPRKYKLAKSKSNGNCKIGNSRQTPDKLQTNSRKTPQPEPEPEPNKRPISNFQLPDDLANWPGLSEAWSGWQDNRRQIKKPLTPASAGAQLKKLRGWGPARALAALEHSTAGSYQGLFEPKAGGLGPQPAQIETKEQREARKARDRARNLAACQARQEVRDAG